MNVGYHRALGLLPMLVLALFALSGRPAHAANYDTCFLWEYQVVDSGGGEDKYPSANGLAYAPGLTVQITDSGNNQFLTAFADQSGCIHWSASPSQAPFKLEVYTEMRDNHSNTLEVNDAGQDRSSSFSDLYSFILTNYTPGSLPDLFAIGDETQEASTMAMASHTLKHYNVDVYSKSIFIGLEDAGCGSNSAHFPSATSPESNSLITYGIHWLSIGTCPDSSSPIPPGTRRKFTIAHEVGHALFALIYANHSLASNGWEPFPENGYAGPANTGMCADTTSGYGINSAEFSSIGWREGFAHFAAARVFNNKASSGNLQWFGINHSLETGAGVSGSGGRLEKICCPTCSAVQLGGAATVGDWMRWLWDAHSNSWGCCPHNLTRQEIYKLYVQSRLRAEVFSGYWAGGMFDAVVDSMALTGADSCLVQQNNSSCGDPKIEDAGGYNGIDN